MFNQLNIHHVVQQQYNQFVQKYVLLSLPTSFPFLSKFGQNELTLLFKNPPVVLLAHLCPTWHDANANELQSTGTSFSVLSKATAFEYLKDCLGFRLIYLERETERAIETETERRLRTS